MGLFQDLTSRFSELPPSQRILLGLGIPLVAAAAIVGQLRGRDGDDGEPGAAGGDGVGGTVIPIDGDFLTFDDFRMGLDDLGQDLRDQIEDLKDQIEDDEIPSDPPEDPGTLPTPTPTPDPAPAPEPEPEPEPAPTIRVYDLSWMNTGQVVGTYPTRLACSQAAQAADPNSDPPGSSMACRSRLVPA